MKQKIITFANHKGGVSKTTSTASIGACMAQMEELSFLSRFLAR